MPNLSLKLTGRPAVVLCPKPALAAPQLSSSVRHINECIRHAPFSGQRHWCCCQWDKTDRGLCHGRFCRSVPADGWGQIPLMVEDIEQLRQSLRVPQIALIGQSFGGTLALEYAARYPEHVSRLVFVAGLWDTPLQCRLRLKTLAERRPDGYRRVRADTLRPDGTRISGCELEMRGAGGGRAWDEYSSEAMYPDSSVRTRIEAVEAAHGYRNTGEAGGALFRGGLLGYRFTNLERLTMPVLIIAGGRDGAARPEGLRELADRLPHATFLEYERSGHSCTSMTPTDSPPTSSTF